MRRRVRLLALVALTSLGAPAGPSEAPEPESRTFYVRHTTGDDASDGSSPETAWRNLSKLSAALRAGDTAYVGPGLYRDQLIVRSSGTSERPIRILADASGVYTHDPAGIVMLTGAEPVDERLFEPHSTPGVYKARLRDFVPVGVVEMDGPQYRYMRARSTREHLVDGRSELEVVAALTSSYFHDAEAGILYLHTSDGAPPTRHELELVRRGAGFTVAHQDFVTVSGFTIRHTGDAGILFSDGSRHGIAIDNVSYGNRIGIRVNGATGAVISGNVLFRNENSGVYFLRESTHGQVLANVLYENVKGARWGSRSNHGRAIGNIAFRNSEAGISVEDSVGIHVMKNRLVHNGQTQLFLLKSRQHQSEGNCFEVSLPEATATLDQSRYADLAAFQKAAGQDLGSDPGACGSLPATIDVRRLHVEVQGYATQASPGGARAK